MFPAYANDRVIVHCLSFVIIQAVANFALRRKTTTGGSAAENACKGSAAGRGLPVLFKISVRQQCTGNSI